MTRITLYVEGADAFATEGQTEIRYGVTLAVGADRVPQQHGSYSPFAALMKPWNWQWPVLDQTRNLADQRLNFPKATSLSGYAPQKRNICATETGLREMENYANACFVNFVENSGGVIGQTGGQRYALDMPRDASGTEVPFEDTSNTIAWPQLLANLAQVPGAVGRRLNLLAGFSTDANVAIERTHLLPSFLVEWGPLDARKQAVLEPGASLSQFGSSEEGYTIFSYGFSGPDGDELDAEFDVEAFVSLRKTPAANNQPDAAGPHLDQKSGWIRLPNEQVDLSTRDWFAEFPIDVQKSLDLPNHFINALKKKLDDNKSKPGNDGSTGSEFELTSELQAKIEEVFIRLVGPSLALGVPPVEQLIQTDNRWLLADWIRKSLLFDVTRSPKLSIEDDYEPLMQLFFADSNDSDTVKEVKKKIVEALVAAASNNDKLFTPEIVVEVGQPVPNGSYRDLADALFEVATENGLERRFQFLRNRFGTPDSAPSEGEDPEATGLTESEEQVQPATANNLSEVLSAIRSENMARPVLYKLYRKAREKVDVPDGQDEFDDLRNQLGILDNRLGLWANERSMPGTGGNSDILGRVLQDRLRYLLEEPLPSKQQTSIWTLLKSFINFFAADSAEEKLIKDVLDRPTPDPTGSDLDTIERVRRATTLVGWVAICRAVAPVLDVDESGEMTPEGSIISDIAIAMASELEARVASLVGVQATDTVDANTPIVLEPKTRSERPEPVVLTIGQIGNTQTSENFTGFGVLARRNETSRNGVSAGDWHCLTLGAPHLIKFAAREVSATNSLIGLGHAPVRIIEQYELSSWIMVNDGKSLSAVPLTVNPENAPSFVPEPEGSNDSEDFGIGQDRIVIVQPEKAAFSDALCGDDPTPGHACLACLNDERLFKFPALKYGETLEYLFFVQKNNSFLPWEIAEADYPGLFRLPRNGSVPARVPPPASNNFKSTVRVRHLRRTPVSAPRLVGRFTREPKLNERDDPMVNNRAFNRRFDPFLTPEINREAVQPLTDLLYGNPSRDPLAQAAPASETGNEQSRKRNDLILLTPPNKIVWLGGQARHSFFFNVLPPTVGIEDYQRWRFRDMRAPTNNLKSDPERNALQYEEDVVATLTAYGAALEHMERVAAGNEETKERAEIAPDDPAVSAIGFRLKQIDISENGTTFSVIDLDKTEIVKLTDNPDHLANMPTVSGPEETLDVERALKVLQGPIRVPPCHSEVHQRKRQRDERSSLRAGQAMARIL